MFGLPWWASTLIGTFGFPLIVDILSMVARRTENSKTVGGEIAHIVTFRIAQALPSYSGAITKGQMKKKLG